SAPPAPRSPAPAPRSAGRSPSRPPPGCGWPSTSPPGPPPPPAGRTSARRWPPRSWCCSGPRTAPAARGCSPRTRCSRPARWPFGVPGPPHTMSGRVEAVLYEDFDRLEDTHWWFSGRRAVVREVLLRKLPRRSGLDVLDVGCGTGGMLVMLRELGSVSGIDTSEAALRHARERLGPAVPLSVGALPDGLPAGRTYDLVTAFDVIEHIPD